MKEKDIKEKLFGKRRYSQIEKDYEEEIVSSIKVAIKINLIIIIFQQLKSGKVT